PPVAKRRGHCQKRGVGATSEIAQKARNLRDNLRARPFHVPAQKAVWDRPAGRARIAVFPPALRARLFGPGGGRKTMPPGEGGARQRADKQESRWFRSG